MFVYRSRMTIPADSPSVSQSVVVVPSLQVGPLVSAVGDPLRWAIVRELSSGEPRMVNEIAQALRKPPSLISKHLVWLRKAGAVVTGRGRLYSIPPQFVPSPGDGVVDYGHLVLRTKLSG